MGRHNNKAEENNKMALWLGGYAVFSFVFAIGCGKFISHGAVSVD